MHSSLCTRERGGRWGAALLIAALAAGAAAAAPADGGPILPLSEVRPGQRGYGLSVFRGDSPERFEVEVLGVWRNVAPDTSYILARLSGQGLESSGVVAGMSGSPVFIDERLAGAVAFAWPFAQEAVAGITPIELMRGLVEGEGAAGPGPRSAWAPHLNDLVAGRLPEDLLATQLARLLPEAGGPARSPLQWSAVGFGADSRSLLEESLGSVAAGGTAGGERCELVAGGPVGGLLVDGDLRLAVTGTVTERLGETILAFGHPFLGLGPVRLPMACAEVVTVLSSRFSSFRISNLGGVVGGFDLDRAPGIRGRLGLETPMVPLRIAVAAGGEPRQFALRVADVPLISPVLVAISVLGVLDTVSRSAGEQGLDLVARFRLAGEGDLEVRQSFDGARAGLEAALHLLAFTSYLLNNRLQAVEIESLDVDLEQFDRPRTASLVEAHASPTLVRPGDKVALNLDLVAYRGERFRRSKSVELPTGLPDGRYSLLVGDGASVDAARLAVERASPVNFRQALELLRGLHSRRHLVVLGLFQGAGLAVAGEVLPQLPGSMRSIWGAAGTGGAQPLRLAVAQQEEMEMEVPIEGILRIDLEVRRREPLAPGDTGGEREAPEGEPEPGAVPAAGEAAAAEPERSGDES